MAPTDRLALVFSGGGAKGAFGVGVLCHFVAAYPQLRWHVVAGTSTGALIAPLAALGATDRGAIGAVRDMYLAARQKRIIRSNFSFPTILKAVVDLPEGVYNFGPLKELVKETMDEARLAQLAASDVACILNAVNLQSGNLVLCTQDSHRPRIEKWFAERGDAQVEFLGYDRFRRAMRASSAVPAAVDPLGEDNVTTGVREQLVDGGVLDIAPLRAAIAAGATHVIAVLMSPRKSIADPKYRDNLLQVATRSVDLLTDEILRNDVETAELVTRLHELALLLASSNAPLPAWLEKYRARVPLELATVEPPLPLGDTFDFDADKRKGWPDEPADDGEKVNIMRARMECGERTAAKAIAAKPELKAILERFAGG